MALNAKKALAASKSYTDETVLGGGALKGKNCVINSITDIAETSQKPAGKRVTFGWTLDDGTAQTGTMDVYNGENGQGIDRMYVNEEGHLVVVYDNGTEEDVGEITIPSFQADWNETDPLENSYIKNKPTIPAAQVNSDWDAVSGVAKILHKPTIPTKVSELQNDSGFEANAIESISVNGTAVAPDANKNVNIVVQGGGGTSDYSDLTNKPSINNVTLSGNKTASDLGLATSNDLNTHVATKGDSGVQGHVSLYQGDVSNKTYAQGEAAASAHTHDTRYAPYSVVADVSGKADKVQNAVNGNLAGLDGGGNLTDSGVAASSVVTDVSGKADKVSSPTVGDFAGLDSNGNLTDSGKKASDFTGKTFDGTSQEWAALSAAQKAEYTGGLVLIKNDTANAMLVDSTPTKNSNNLVKSGGVYAHRVVAGKQADTTLGLCATAEGLNNQASGDYCHVEGRLNLASGQASHAEGYTSIARGDYSHAGGYWNLAQKKGQTVIGRLNEYEEYTESTDYGVYAFIIGNGTSNNARHNAFAVKWDGTHEINGDVIIGQHYDSTQSQNVGSNLTVSGVVNVNGSDYAEKFESIEDCPVGRFVTLDGEKIRLAQPEDDYILGIISENPAIIGDKDNPGTPVGLVGKLWVESDGTCKVNGFAVSGANGIATDGGSTGYRVMAVDGNRVKVLVK